MLYKNKSNNKIQRLGSELVTSINEPNLLSKTLIIGDRPIDMFKFLTPLIGNDNLQIFTGSRAKSLRKLLMPSLGHHGNNITIVFYF